MIDVASEVEAHVEHGDFNSARSFLRQALTHVSRNEARRLFEYIRLEEAKSLPAPQEFVLGLFRNTFPEGIFTGTHVELRDALGLRDFKTQQVRYAMWRSSAWDPEDCCPEVPIVRGRPEEFEPGSGVYSYQLVA